MDKSKKDRKPAGSHAHNHKQSGEDEAHENHGMLLWVLTRLQRYSAPFLSVFLGIHLAAPIAALFGGSELSTKVMLLGREYYQGKYTEPLLLFVPLGIHVGSSVTRRFILGQPRKPSLIQITAYTALFAVPLHIWAHRIVPSDPTPPISSFSPSEMSFEFIKAGFANYPILAAISYPFLAAVVAFHAAEGAAILTRWFTGSAPSRRVRRGLAGLITLAVTAGVFTIYQEPLMMRGAQLTRVDEIYERGYPFLKLLVGS
ncbi:hypothetical protein CPB86DRAFT_780627 [Serendipita vermifera]|nr:hypothetical protein CPB86DRAFT_780627 [Serendipita vermifera]